MTIVKRLVPAADVKKNDDPIEGGARPASASMMPTLRGPRKKRILLCLVALLVVYFFIKYLPSDVPPVSRRSYESRYGLLRAGASSTASALTNDGLDLPPRPQGVAKERYFDGPVKFYHLTSSLYRAMIPKDNTRNVLFVISDIKSASNILPTACKMSRRQRNKVHIAVFGRHDINVEAIKEIYGTSDLDCPVDWHDARPDHAAYSSDLRMEVSVRAALNHLLYYLKPHAIIANDPDREDHYFVGAVREASGPARVPLITLPDPAVERLGWVSLLEGTSLGNWDKLQVEILVHGSATSSASVIRLLKSIENADYSGAAYPRLTIELPEITDPPTLEFLSNFRWPPGSSEADSKITVRRRLSSKQLTPVEASLQTVESFYPIHPDTSHVLVLTANAELSPAYFGYLKYLLLEYRYSNFATSSESAAKLIGISLESPSELLNGSQLDVEKVAQGSSTPLILWQAPNSHAALYFGDKWVEFHSFLSRRLSTARDMSSAATRADTVSEDHPTWLAHLLELARARAYYMLYPVVKTGGTPLVTIHNELYQSPVDLSKGRVQVVATLGRPAPVELTGDEVLTGDQEQERLTRSEPMIRNTESQMSLLLTAGNTTLPQLESLPLVSHDAIPVSLESLLQLSVSFADRFSVELGGCQRLQDRAPASVWTADDLFCDEDRSS